MSESHAKGKLTYAAAGVDITAGEEAVDRIKQLAARTFSRHVLAGIGSFGGFFRLDTTGMTSPVLVSSTDSVGTKVKMAFMTDRHDTVGEDLVNHCVNDILVHGARALYFLDYIGIHKVTPEVVTGLVTGVSRACEANGVALLGGETAEMPDLYAPGEYDLAGFIVGIVDEPKIINGSTIKAGDVCIGLASSGLHTNGYTLARKIAFDIAGLKPGDMVEALGETIDGALMRVHRCYAGLIHPLLSKYTVHGMAHITGGGIPGNLKRIMPDGLSAVIHKGSWPVPAIFDFLGTKGKIDADELYRAFNMGIGYILVVPSDEAEQITKDLTAAGETPFRIGEVVTGTAKVVLE
ncbi:MAG: phosphoribosylformylglycinamidine cyclo-ligase [Candidatus Zixiibacteriota bacterium]|nr:MAG: phosphoribosylformylglycinamidine cyclo-ligase [candidate division Zixibacteria bacterium]